MEKGYEMLDIRFYLPLIASKEDENLIAKYFGKKEFANLASAQWFFKNQTTEKVSWINSEADKAKLPDLCKLFGEKLDSEQLSFNEKKEMVLDQLDKDSSLMSFLEPKGTRSVTIVCPKCKGFGDGNTKGKPERGWIPVQGTAKSIICQHRSSCGFSSDFIGAFAEEYNMKYGAALNHLATELGIDFTINEAHIGATVKQTPKQVNLTPKVVEKKAIEYIVFDKNIKYTNVDFTRFVKHYSTMTELQKFKMVATAIYEFSKTTKQWSKTAYFNSMDINSKKNPLLASKVEMINSKLGCLFKADIPSLIKKLRGFFPLADLIKFGVVDNSLNFMQSVEEALIVIPNLDLYTNMCSGLKYRKTKLKTWIDKENNLVVDKNKEPEFSYGRIANPLPYHLTREALLDESISFRFFEGQKDLHSMPSVDKMCDVAIPGVNGITVEALGLFKGRRVKLYFDQDKAGQEGAMRLKTILEEAEVIVKNITWDIELGADINEVLQNGNILKIKDL